MTEVQRIVRDIDFSDDDSVAVAMGKLKCVSDFELMHYTVLGETLNTTKSETRKAIALCRTERERRQDAKLQNLTYKSSCGAAAIGAVATVVGALIGAAVTFFLSNAEFSQPIMKPATQGAKVTSEDRG